ncbi:lipid-A-disaccharide synthase [Desulfonatronovibrio magnus]|uniref:lipid-A-disaccharide synthase n=1 Tax=Desulfonatronovibrio magnus TaxID=698827 RepID=UPI0005EB63B8|nr:lipid-A-disaccharide synthase [Desulfonatronovibrio magnus]
MKNNLVWINVCESSADVYGAMLMQAIRNVRPEVSIMGMGGPAMRRAGLETVCNSEELSLVGLTEVFSALPRITVLLRRVYSLMRSKRPSALVLMDAPDFNFHLARMAAGLNIPVIYYIAPQIWAWRKSRVKFLQKYVDAVACIFPFEQKFFHDHGIKAHFTGHPLMEMLQLDELDRIKPQNNQIALLPGSRKKEISSLLPEFTVCAENLRKTRPELRFNIVQAPGITMELLQQYCPPRPWIRYIQPENRHETIRKSVMAIAASGTVTLECAILKVPTIVAYKLSALSYLLGKMLIHVKHISMPNLILGKTVFPELIQHEARGDCLTEVSGRLLDNPESRQEIKNSLSDLRTKLGGVGATRQCARLVLKFMGNR